MDKLCRVIPSHLEATWGWLRSLSRYLFLVSMDPATELCSAELNKDISNDELWSGTRQCHILNDEIQATTTSAISKNELILHQW